MTKRFLSDELTANAGKMTIEHLLPKLAAEFSGRSVANLDRVATARRDVAQETSAVLFGQLRAQVDADLAAPPCRQCEPPMARHYKSKKTLMSRIGHVEVNRTYDYCRDGGEGYFLLDRMLGLEGEKMTPGVAKLVADAVSTDSYNEASRKLENWDGLSIPPKTLPRWATKCGKKVHEYEQLKVAEPAAVLDRIYVEVDGTGVPMRTTELENVKGKPADGSAKTREARDKKTGLTVEDNGSDRISGAIDSAAAVAGRNEASAFGQRRDRHSRRTGTYAAQEVVVIADGAHWIKSVATELLAGKTTTFILDLFYALEYAAEAMKALYQGEPQQKHGLEKLKRQLLNGDVATVIAELEPDRKKGAAIGRCIDYYTVNKERRRDNDYRARGMQIGSGQIESDCKNLVACRFKKTWGAVVKDRGKCAYGPERMLEK